MKVIKYFKKSLIFYLLFKNPVNEALSWLELSIGALMLGWKKASVKGLIKWTNKRKGLNTADFTILCSS